MIFCCSGKMSGPFFIHASNLFTCSLKKDARAIEFTRVFLFLALGTGLRRHAFINPLFSRHTGDLIMKKLCLDTRQTYNSSHIKHLYYEYAKHCSMPVCVSKCELPRDYCLYIFVLVCILVKNIPWSNAIYISIIVFS